MYEVRLRIEKYISNVTLLVKKHTPTTILNNPKAVPRKSDVYSRLVALDAECQSVVCR
jgi:hypothetical protein